MNGSGKIFAPKPVKANSNANGVKIISNFEKINTLPFNSHTPKPVKNNSEYNLNRKTEYLFMNPENNTCNRNSENIIKVPFRAQSNKFLCDLTSNDQQSHFETDLGSIERDFQNIREKIDESLSKSEILSILRNDSTNYESCVYRSENALTCEKDDVEDSEFFFVDDIRTSMPPIRSKNPFYKNYDLDKSLETPVIITGSKIKKEQDFDLNDEDYFYGLGENYDPK